MAGIPPDVAGECGVKKRHDDVSAAVTLCILLAAGGRPELLHRTLERTLANIVRHDTRLTVLLDEDDTQAVATAEKFFPVLDISVAPREGIIGVKYNRGLTLAPGSVYINMVDDAPHVTRGFDQAILNALTNGRLDQSADRGRPKDSSMNDAAVLDLPFGQQNPEELAFLMRYATGAERILEIGSCFGHSLRMLARVAVNKSVIRSIDLGKLPAEAANFAGYDVRPILENVISELEVDGYDAKLHIGDSHIAQSMAFADKAAPYDVVFIDGDHSYDGVTADFLNYGPMSRHLIAFHDIAHPAHGVGKLWAELKECGMRTDEKIASHMGIGVLIKA